MHHQEVLNQLDSQVEDAVLAFDEVHRVAGENLSLIYSEVAEDQFGLGGFLLDSFGLALKDLVVACDNRAKADPSETIEPFDPNAWQVVARQAIRALRQQKLIYSLYENSKLFKSSPR
jgi:hypothetical protein